MLYPDGCEDVARELATTLTDAFHDYLTVTLIPATSPSPWPAPCAWDDVLVVLFHDGAYPDAGNDYIGEFLRRKDGGVTLLPVALNLNHQRPPAGAEGFKSLPYDVKAKGPRGRFANRVGALLGLRVRPAENKIFISYSGRDGTNVAKRLYEHLVGLKYNPWMDEAREIDDETKILPGSLVQQEIDNAINDANLVLLIDTPAAPHSEWIQHEVNTANASILPVLPLWFRTKNDHNTGPRFRSLLRFSGGFPLNCLEDLLRCRPRLLNWTSSWTKWRCFFQRFFNGSAEFRCW
jgi:hypothetical protein